MTYLLLINISHLYILIMSGVLITIKFLEIPNEKQTTYNFELYFMKC